MATLRSPRRTRRRPSSPHSVLSSGGACRVAYAIATSLGVVACDDCQGSAALQPPATASVSAAPAEAPSTSAEVPPARDCRSICNDYWMYLARDRRLCGGNSGSMDRRWITPACSRTRSEWNWSRSQVDVHEEGLEDKAGPLCSCGNSELPRKTPGKQQVSSPVCDSVCRRATSLHIDMEGCGGLPDSPGYDDPRCLELEKRFYGMRPEIFDCWCTRVIRLDREAQ